MSRQLISSQYSLIDLTHIIRAQKWTFIVVAIASATLGAFSFHSTPKLWSARAQVRIGQIQNLGISETSRFIEPPRKVANGILQEYYLNKIFSATYSQSEPERTRAEIIFLNTFSAYPHVDSDIVELKVNALSAQKAEAFIRAAVLEIKRNHDPIFDAHKRRIEKVITLAEQGLERLRSGGKIDSPERLFAQFTFEEKILSLQDKVDPTLNYPTQLAEEIHLSNRAEQPKGILYVAGFALAGMLLTLLALIYRKR